MPGVHPGPCARKVEPSIEVGFCLHILNVCLFRRFGCGGLVDCGRCFSFSLCLKCDCLSDINVQGGCHRWVVSIDRNRLWFGVGSRFGFCYGILSRLARAAVTSGRLRQARLATEVLTTGTEFTQRYKGIEY
jgi:hypothetical protein